jgi:hypothetical protein
MTEEREPDGSQSPVASNAAAGGASTQEQTADLAHAQPQVLSAVSPSRLAAPTPPEAVKDLSCETWWATARQVAFEWQSISVWADFWELAAPRVQHGRGHELAGCIADGGERLALALAAVTEAELWRIYRRDLPPEVRDLDGIKRRSVDAANEMAHRAMAESATYYLLATGHTVVNVAARALALDSQLHAVLLDVLGSWYPVGSSERDDWLSLNKDTVRRLRRAAKQAKIPAAQDLAIPPTDLLMSQAWQELDQLRGAHYHRRRPQSAGIAGVPLASPWTFTSDAMHMEGGGGGEYVDGDNLANRTTDLARRVLNDLISVMRRLLVIVRQVVDEINT